MASLESESSTGDSAVPTSAHPAVAESHNGEDSSRPSIASDDHHSSASSSASHSDADSAKPNKAWLQQRPGIGSRKSSGTLIVSRESTNIELENEEYDENDARTMSPRRTSEEIEQMGKEARQALEDQAKQLQASLLEVVERVESVKTEHEKLEGGNRFLQSYIGELMQTSKITSTGASKGKVKGKVRPTK